MTRRLGIDIGGTSVKAACLEGERVLATGLSDRYDDPDPAVIASAIEQAIGTCHPASVDSVGACLPGLLDDAGRLVASVNLPRLIGSTPRDWINEVVHQADCRTAVHSLHADAICAALGHWHDVGRPAGRMLALSLGTGVGVGLLDDGTPRRGVHGLGGHLGQIDVSPAIPERPVPEAPDGALGTLEAYLGWRRLRDTIGEAGLMRLRVDDAPARALIYALRLVHPIYRPHHIALLGGVGTALAPIVDPIRERVASGLTSLAQPDWTLAVGGSVHLAAVGAALSAGGPAD